MNNFETGKKTHHFHNFEIGEALGEAFQTIPNVGDIINKIQNACLENYKGTNMLFTTDSIDYVIVDFYSGVMISWTYNLNESIDCCLEEFTISDLKDFMKNVAEELN